MNVLLWPPNPNPKSWKSDIPNEGLQFGWSNEGLLTDYDNGITDYHADYQGHYILDPDDVDTIFPRFCFAPTDHCQYLAAYMTILNLSTGLWKNPRTTDWPTVAHQIVEVLKLEGWREVEAYEENGNYFRWKTNA